MSYQLPPLTDEVQFEELIRDILRRVYNDPGIEKFGRKGQTQYGIDGSNSGVTFQCKLKDTRYETDKRLRAKLLTEMEEELGKTEGLDNRPRRFIFATTFKNDQKLQQKATSLTTESITVEYWGWDTINEKIWDYAESLIPIYYSWCPIRQVSGFRQINNALITKVKAVENDELNKLANEYYRINDRSELVFRVVCNDLDVRNDKVMDYALGRLKALSPGGTLWIVGDGGSGKTTILHRLAVELARQKQNVYMLDLETHPGKDDLETILSVIKYCRTSEPTVLCIDNPADDEETLEALLRRIPDYCDEIHILLSERAHRYRALQKAGRLTYLHGEEGSKPVVVWNSDQQRQKVYSNLFKLLGVSDDDIASLRGTVLDERLVYVNATYSILLELKRRRKIVFDFDWDDYRKATDDIPAFSEGYKYIALFYLFGVRTPFTALSKTLGADETQQNTFLERFRGLTNEPIILDERRDDSFRKAIHVRTKHEIISEIFFIEHSDINKDELLMGWCEKTDFADPLEAQALINIFGAKKNYLDAPPHVDFRKLTDFLLRGYLNEKVALSKKLNATLHLAKFWLLLFKNKTEEAANVLESFLQIAPEDLHSRTELAKAYFRLGRLGEAEIILLKILEIKPDDLNSRIELAKVYRQQNKLIEAETVLLKLLDIEHNNIWGHTELAKVYQRQGRLAEAEAALLSVLEIKQNDLNSRTELAKIYQRQNKLADAEAVLLRILEIKRNDLNSRTELAKIYQRQGKLAEAEAVLMELLELEPDSLQARTELAKIYQRQGKLAEAEALLLRSLEIDANQLHPRTELAKVYQAQGRYDEAEQVVNESLKIDFDQIHPRTERARSYISQGQFRRARAEVLGYIQHKYDINNQYIAHLILAYLNACYRMRRYQDGVDFIDNFGCQFISSVVAEEYGRLLRADDLSSAVMFFQTALRIFKNASRLLSEAAICFKLAGRVDAEDILEMAIRLQPDKEAKYREMYNDPAVLRKTEFKVTDCHGFIINLNYERMEGVIKGNYATHSFRWNKRFDSLFRNMKISDEVLFDVADRGYATNVEPIF